LDCSPLLESKEPTDWILAVLCRMEKEERDLRELLKRFKNLPEPKREKYLRFLDVEKDPLFLEGLEYDLIPLVCLISW
jgi:hypothetical protein